MKRIMFLSLVLVLGGVSIAWAELSRYEADSYTYQMVLNKDENLCPGIMAELNQDLAQFKEIRYASHRNFPVVKWKRMSELGSKFSEEKPFNKWRWAKFDFNNDSVIDLVVRISSDDEGGPNDLYFIFNGGYQGLKQVRNFQQFMDTFRNAGIGSVHTTSGYILRELPPSSPAVENEWIERLYAITPFLMKGVTYFHIDQAESNDDHSLFHVVTKFTRAAVVPGKGEYSEVVAFGRNPNELEDVCYFKMFVDEQRTVQRSVDQMTLKP